MRMKNLREYMKREGIGQRELARRLGVSESLVSLWMSGARQIGKQSAPAVAHLLGVAVTDILYPKVK